MPSLQAVRAANAAVSFTYQPIAVFVGGTSGIGEGMARAFARHTNGNARIIIIGRNRAAAEETIASFPKPAGLDAVPLHEFVECDLTLMKNVREAAHGLLERLPKLNFLVMSPGFMTFKGRDETDEGIDKKLAVHYYARWRMTYDLMPLLRKAKDVGDDAKVMSVLAPGYGGAVDLDDLGLKKTYSLKAAALQAPTYNDLMVEAFAEQHSSVAFTHIHPGIVRTNLLRGINYHWASFILSPLLSVMSYLIGVSQDDCAEYMLFALYQCGAGAHRMGSRGEDIGRKRYFSAPAAWDALWQHTLQVTDV